MARFFYGRNATPCVTERRRIVGESLQGEPKELFRPESSARIVVRDQA